MTDENIEKNAQGVNGEIIGKLMLIAFNFGRDYRAWDARDMDDLGDAVTEFVADSIRVARGLSGDDLRVVLSGIETILDTQISGRAP